jgi:hypothetical protein
LDRDCAGNQMLHLVGGTNEVQHKPQMLPTYHSMQSSCGMQNNEHHEFVLLSHKILRNSSVILETLRMKLKYSTSAAL